MKTLKAMCSTAILALLLSVPAFAGEVETPGLASKPPATTSKASTSGPNSAVAGEISSPGFVDLWVFLISVF